MSGAILILRLQHRHILQLMGVLKDRFGTMGLQQQIITSVVMTNKVDSINI
jgi:hypothetical protein